VSFLSISRIQDLFVKTLFAALIFLTTFSFFTLSSSADTLTLVSTGGQSVNGEFIYPYNLSVNGSSALKNMMCIDFARHVTFGETWNVKATAIPLDSSTTSNDYRALALILFASETGYMEYSLSDYQFAAWSIFDPLDISGSSAFTPNAMYIRNLALQYAASPTTPALPGFSYSNFTVYLPTDNHAGWTDGTPQRFMGDVTPVPEPSGLLFLGTGLVGVAVSLRRRILARLPATRRS